MEDSSGSKNDHEAALRVADFPPLFRPYGEYWHAVDGGLAPAGSQKRMWILIL